MPNVSDGRGELSSKSPMALPPAVLTGVVDGALSSAEDWLRRGGHVDARGPEQTWRKCTLLMAASLSGNELIARLLLEHRASVDLVDSQGGTALMAACLKGDGPTISALVAAGASLDVQNADGFSALIYASLYGHSDGVRALVDAGASVDLQDARLRTALLYTCRRGHAPAARLLLEAGARTDLCEGDQQRTALQWAAENGHTGLVSLLETHAITPLVRAADDADAAAGADGAPPAADLLLHQRVRIVGLSARPQLNGRIGTVTTYDSRSGRYGIQLDDGDRRWAQNAWKKVACVAKNLQLVTDAPGAAAPGGAPSAPPTTLGAGIGAGEGWQGSPAKAAELPADVLEAVCDGDTAAAELWLRRGGHVDGRGPEEEGWFRITLLMIAARGGHETTARLLLQHRASVDLQDSKGGTALMYSSFYGHEAIARLLLQHHAALDRQNALGRTPLMAACLKGHDAIVRLLLRAGARTDLRDTEHQLTALEFAEHKGNSRCVDLLKSSAARVGRRGPLDRMHVLDPDPPKGAKGGAPSSGGRRWAAMPASQRVGGGRNLPLGVSASAAAGVGAAPVAASRRMGAASVAEVQTWRAADGS